MGGCSRVRLGCGGWSVENGKLPATAGRKASGLDDEVAGLPTEWAIVDAFTRWAAADLRIGVFRSARRGCCRLRGKRQCSSRESKIDRRCLRALPARSGRHLRGVGPARRGPFRNDPLTPFCKASGNTALKDFGKSYGLKLIMSARVSCDTPSFGNGTQMPARGGCLHLGSAHCGHPGGYFPSFSWLPGAPPLAAMAGHQPKLPTSLALGAG